MYIYTVIVVIMYMYCVINGVMWIVLEGKKNVKLTTFFVCVCVCVCALIGASALVIALLSFG